MAASLVLGPMLRHVDATSATVWVETDAPCTVSVLGAEQHTFQVEDRHYALVCIDGLEPGTSTPYEVRLDGRLEWPPADTKMPVPRIRTLSPGRRTRLAFGSCRYASTLSVVSDGRYGTDALDAYARLLADAPDEEWPDGLMLLGDQVYADDTSPLTQDVIRRRRDVSKPPGLQVANFAEYAALYNESWGDPLVRWLYATVPTSMIFDDHDIHDDWNTSGVWRRRMQRTSWWQERITGGLTAYWIYQHIGNLSPAALAEDEIYRKVCASEGDVGPLLHEFAAAADREADGAKGYRWSYRRDLFGVRVVVIDSRCGRILDDRERAMLGRSEAKWIEDQLDGEYEHLVLGTSLPWLLPRAVHDLESWDEALCAGSRGERMIRFGEKMREAADLEHWAAFRASFDWLAGVIAEVGRRPDAPATVCVLSGDVHHQYVAEARWPEPITSRVHQIVISPVHHSVPISQRTVFRVGWSRLLEKVTTALGRWDDVPPLPVHWSKTAGPYFGNALGTLVFSDRDARFRLDKAMTTPQSEDRMEPVVEMELS
ncbi:MAG TPA: alkaline phosphatase D family protein [Mycobacteriales bacterium]